VGGLPETGGVEPTAGISRPVGPGRLRVDVGELASGAYLCRLRTGSGGVHVEKLVAVDDCLPVNRNFRGDRRFRAGPDHDRLPFNLCRPARTRHQNRSRALEACNASQNLDAVTRKLRLRHVNLRLDHMLDPEGQVRHGDLFFDAVAYAVNILVIVAGEMQNGFTHRFARNCPGIDANAADYFAPFN